jgi:hypothetical protein
MQGHYLLFNLHDSARVAHCSIKLWRCLFESTSRANNQEPDDGRKEDQIDNDACKADVGVDLPQSKIAW